MKADDCQLYGSRGSIDHSLVMITILDAFAVFRATLGYGILYLFAFLVKAEVTIVGQLLRDICTINWIATTRLTPQLKDLSTASQSVSSRGGIF